MRHAIPPPPPFIIRLPYDYLHSFHSWKFAYKNFSCQANTHTHTHVTYMHPSSVSSVDHLHNDFISVHGSVHGFITIFNVLLDNLWCIGKMNASLSPLSPSLSLSLLPSFSPPLPPSLPPSLPISLSPSYVSPSLPFSLLSPSLSPLLFTYVI